MKEISFSLTNLEEERLEEEYVKSIFYACGAEQYL